MGHVAASGRANFVRKSDSRATSAVTHCREWGYEPSRPGTWDGRAYAVEKLNTWAVWGPRAAVPGWE